MRPRPDKRPANQDIVRYKDEAYEWDHTHVPTLINSLKRACFLASIMYIVVCRIPSEPSTYNAICSRVEFLEMVRNESFQIAGSCALRLRSFGAWLRASAKGLVAGVELILSA